MASKFKSKGCIEAWQARKKMGEWTCRGERGRECSRHREQITQMLRSGKSFAQRNHLVKVETSQKMPNLFRPKGEDNMEFSAS